MKKVLAFLLGAVLLVSFASCGKDGDSSAKTPEEVYSAAVAKLSELKALDMGADMTITMESEGASISIGVDLVMKMLQKGDDDFDMEMSMNSDMFGQTLDFKVYYVDGVMYTDIMGQKVKMEMPATDALNQTGSQSAIFEMDPQWFSELNMTEEEDGSKTFTFTADPAKMKEYTDKLTSQVTQQMDESGMTINSVSGSVTVNQDGYISGQNLVMDCTMDVEGQSMNAKVELDATVNNPGQTFEIVVPDKDSYTETNLGDLAA